MGTSPELRLQELADEARERIRDLERDHAEMVANIDSSTDDEHDPEGTTAFERAQIRALIEATQTQLTEIAGARERVRNGTYGQCERCGTPISDARLEARPTARTCVSCPT